MRAEHGRRDEHVSSTAPDLVASLIEPIERSRMKGLLVVGGRQQEARPLRAGHGIWRGYDKGMIIHIDLASDALWTCFEYVTPDEVQSADEAAVSLQGSTIEQDRLYTCTPTEVMVYSLPSFERLHYVTLPWFNDVHHVRPSLSGNILVANAGLEMILEISVAGEVLKIWNALFEDPWERFDPTFDYRKISTKPHRSHPNFVFYLGSEVWTTRFQQGDAVSLSTPERSITISSERIHDGVWHDGNLYFTTVDGKIVIVNAESLEVSDTIDLTRFHPDRMFLGWCRGILVDGDHLWVGFSRIRPTRFRQNVSWLARGFRHGRPTHIGCYDLVAQTCVADVDLEALGMAAVYSILPATQDFASRQPRDLETMASSRPLSYS